MLTLTCLFLASPLLPKLLIEKLDITVDSFYSYPPLITFDSKPPLFQHYFYLPLILASDTSTSILLTYFINYHLVPSQFGG